MKVRLIIASHKKAAFPVDPLYVPVQAGAACSSRLDFTGDDSGVSISERNPSFCELTALYWAWKNYPADALGLVHYRRYFTAGKPKGKELSQVLRLEEAETLLETCPVLVPKKRHYYIETLYSHYAHTHYALHLDEMGRLIEERCPQYLSAWTKVLRARSGYMFNMMLMRRDLMNEYCSWLFDLLFALEERAGKWPEDMREEALSPFQKRFYGRISEILFNVWLQKKLDSGELSRAQVRELPVLFTEDQNLLGKTVHFLMAKFLHRRYDHSM